MLLQVIKNDFGQLKNKILINLKLVGLFFLFGHKLKQCNYILIRPIINILYIIQQH